MLIHYRHSRMVLVGSNFLMFILYFNFNVHLAWPTHDHQEQHGRKGAGKSKVHPAEPANARPYFEESWDSTDLTKLENVCGEKPQSPVRAGKDANLQTFLAKVGDGSANTINYGHLKQQKRRRKRNILSDLLVSNLISVICGSLMNDFTASSLWDKLSECYRLVVLRGHFLGGWKRCWEYWWLGEQRWRKALKPHLITQMHRKAAAMLLKLDQGKTHYNAALVQIQEDFNGLLLSGEQATRLINIMHNAGIVLADMDWRPREEHRFTPEQMATQLVKYSLQETGTRFSKALQAYTQVLNILRSSFAAHIEAAKRSAFDHKLLQSPPIDERPVPGFHFPANQLLPVGLDRTAFAQMGLPMNIGVRYLQKFLTEWVDNARRKRSAANHLFLHATLAMYTQQLLRFHRINAQDDQVMAKAKSLTGLAHCLLKLSKNKEKYSEFDGKLPAHGEETRKRLDKLQQQPDLRGIHETLLFKGAVLEQFAEVEAEGPIPVAGGDPIKASEDDHARMGEVGHALFHQYESLLEMAANTTEQIKQKLTPELYEEKQENKVDDGIGTNANQQKMPPTAVEDCDYAESVLAFDWAQVDNKEMGLGVKFEADKLLPAKRDDVEKENATNVAEGNRSVLGRMEAQIQRHFFPKPANAANPKKDKQLLLKLNHLVAKVKLALLGHRLSQDLVDHGNSLNRIAVVLGMEPLDLNSLQSEPGQFWAVAVNLMDRFLELLNFKPNSFSEAGDEMKRWFNAFGQLVSTALGQSPRLQLSIKELEEKRMEKAKKTLDQMEEALAEWLNGGMLVEQNDHQQPSAAAELLGTSPFGVPMRMSQQLMATTLKQATYIADKPQLRSAMQPPAKEADPTLGEHRRSKRIIDIIIWGLVTGWLGNWISQYIDISKTFRDWFCFKFHIVWTNDTLRKQREKGMLNFLERSYKILIAKVAELDKTGTHLEDLLKDMSHFLVASLHGEGAVTSNEHVDPGTVLLQLDILTYDDFRHHIEHIIDDGQEAMTILKVIRAFKANGYMQWRECEKHFWRMKRRLELQAKEASLMRGGEL